MGENAAESSGDDGNAGDSANTQHRMEKKSEVIKTWGENGKW